LPKGQFILKISNAEICREVADCFEVEHWNAEALTAAIGASVTGKVIAVESLSFFPGVGWAVKSVVAGAVTKAVGEVIIQYFKSQSPYNDCIEC
jgi:uncharacterized protein (DUF697 family)